MPALRNLQLELINLYASVVSDETLREVKGILAKYFAEKAAGEMDKVWEETGLTEQDMIDWTNQHARSEDRPGH
jgi:hypothetical protein